MRATPITGDRWDRAFVVGLTAITVVYVGLFFYYVKATLILQPHSDVYIWVMRYLQYEQDGRWWAFLWAPHVQSRLLWIRLLTAFDIKVFSGVGYPFVVFAVACQLVTTWLLVREIPTESGRTVGVAIRCGVVILMLTSVGAVSCATLINVVYPQALMFVVLAVMLFDGAGESRSEPNRVVRARRGAALLSAMGASVGNVAALTVWPILLWAAWRGRAGRAWMMAVLLIGATFMAFYLTGLAMAPIRGAGSGPAGTLDASQLLKMLTYLVTYLGLPWTRAAALAPIGRLLGALLGIGSVWAVIRFGLLRPATSRIERLAVAMVVFSLASALLAAILRVDVDVDVVVPVRYAVFVAPLHVGLVFLAWPYLVRHWEQVNRRRLIEVAMLGAACVLLAQQVAAGEAAAATTRSMRATIERFLAGETTPEMTRIIFPDLEQARRYVETMRGAGLYLDVK